jgi:transcriptional regulatory protein LevR
MENLDMDQLLTLITHCSREYEVVHRLSKQLEIGLAIKLTSAEISFLALFLASHRSKKEPEIIKVLVIAHGEHTATSMAEVANYLLVEKRVHALDMPLSQSVEQTLQNAVKLVREMGKIKGVLLMVDMGSLTGFGVALSSELGIPVAVIPFVTTAAVIEAARLTGDNTTDLSLIVQAVKQVYDFDAVFPLQSEGKRIIITTCLTGQGTARKLAAFIIETLPEDSRNNTLVLPVDMKNGSEITSLFVEGWRGTVIAAVGTVDPHLPGVPFIGMEQILFGNGMQALVKLAVNGDILKADSKELIKEDALILASRFITDYIDSQEGQSFANAAIASMHNLEQVMGKPLTPSQSVRWVIHLAFALERLSTDGLVMECDDLAYLEKQHGNLLDMLEQSVFQGSQTLSITIPRSEIGYLALIVLSG